MGYRLCERGEVAEGVELLRQALAHNAALYESDPIPQAHRDLAISQEALRRCSPESHEPNS